MAMKRILMQLFYTMLLLTISIVCETYTINLANEKDDLFSAIGIILSFLIVLNVIFVSKNIWLNNLKPKK